MARKSTTAKPAARTSKKAPVKKVAKKAAKPRAVKAAKTIVWTGDTSNPAVGCEPAPSPAVAAPTASARRREAG